MYAGNTLYCGNRQQTRPSLISQGFGQGYNLGYSYNRGYGQEYNPGYGQENNPGYGQEYNHGYGTLLPQGYTSYPMQSEGGCSSGVCSASYSGYQTLPAKTSGDQTEETMSADTLPAPIKFEEFAT